MKKKLTITVLVDNPKSWFVPHGRELVQRLKKRGHRAFFAHNMNGVKKGDCAFYLSCEKIIPARIRSRNTHNVVIHGSALPKGKGMSPLTWQVLEGKNRIPHTVFEAADSVDSGVVYDRGDLKLEGQELLDEMHEKQGALIVTLALRFIENFPPKKATRQKGSSSHYRRRTPEDSELDPRRSLAEQFNLLRVVNNEKHPAFFKHGGHTYILKIYKKT
ncbi:methionyl-tRNA formyltransferase [Candidatus Kaiserbacteria bacterium]|nr:methionyl-tRNA formyltransferase [Candidatus Kaiserbacteria bacterium]